MWGLYSALLVNIMHIRCKLSWFECLQYESVPEIIRNKAGIVRH